MTQRTLALLAALLALPASASAQKLCVFDLAGLNGPQFNQAKDYALEARKLGVTFDLKGYTDERLATEDFKAEQCDGMMVTGIRARQFNAFAGTLDSIGSLPSFRHLRVAVETLANPKLAADMKSGDYEVAGIIPLGAAYVFVRDRSVNSVEKIAGKKIAVLDYDKSQAKLVQQLGAQPVSSEIINFGAKFNNGQVDVIAAPAMAYGPLELRKGLGSQGAIFRLPLIQLSAHVVLRASRFPADFGAKSRTYFAGQLDRAEKSIVMAEKIIPGNNWLDLPPQDKERYQLMLREARISLTKDGFYDRKMIGLLKKIRCRLEPGNAECSDSAE